MKKVILIMALAVAAMAPPGAQEKDAYALLILPVKQIVPNEEYAYLRSVISSVLALNLGSMENLRLVDAQGAAIDESSDYATILEALAGMPDLDIFLLTEYFLHADGLHMTVSVLESGSNRVKNSFTRVMPADLDMIRNIENMAKFVAVSVSQSLPKFSRDEILSRQVAAELQDQLDREERRVSEIFRNSHEIALCPFTGIATGRSLASWSEAGPLATVPLSLEYRFMSRRLWHIGLSLDYLPLDLMQADGDRWEANASITAGAHTASLISLGWSAGVSAGYSDNDASAAISYRVAVDEVAYPPARRFSVCVPLEAGITQYLNDRWFYNLRVKYTGLSWTFEPLGPEEYDEGNAVLRYDRGLSPWSLLHFSLMVYAGIRL